MKETTLCYLERDGRYLMLHRTKKENDVNRDKWIGVGGKLEAGETPDGCMRREVREETGLTVSDARYRGVVTFLSDRDPDEIMHLFTVTGWSGEETVCDEGDLAWIPKDEVPSLPLWEGDRVFLDLLAADAPFFRLTLSYRGDTLDKAEMDGRRLSI